MGAVMIHGGAVLIPDGLCRNWGVQVEGSRIAAVAANGELPVSPEDEVLEASEHLIMPGFVNGHNHMYGFLSHGITAETMVTEFSGFLDDFWWPYLENRLNHRLVSATTAWACVEMIDSGVTSFAGILEGPNAIPGALEVERENASFMERTAGQNVQGLMSTHMHLSENVFEPNWCAEHYGKRPVEVSEEWDGLEAGKLADLICVRMDTPTPINEYNVYDQLVLFRNPGDVTHVMADGRWLKRDGKLTTLDRERVRRELADRFWKLQEGADVK